MAERAAHHARNRSHRLQEDLRGSGGAAGGTVGWRVARRGTAGGGSWKAGGRAAWDGGRRVVGQHGSPSAPNGGRTAMPGAKEVGSSKGWDGWWDGSLRASHGGRPAKQGALRVRNCSWVRRDTGPVRAFAAKAEGAKRRRDGGATGRRARAIRCSHLSEVSAWSGLYPEIESKKYRATETSLNAM